MIKISPSILAANYSRLGEEIKDVEKGGADYIHIDVMDGHFVPNITVGPLIVEAIRTETKLPLDVHLMIENPDFYIEAFVKSGADCINVHAEACKHLHRTVHFIKTLGVNAGVALNPATPVNVIEHIVEDIDAVILMTVNPGFGNQPFIPSMLPKISAVKDIKDNKGLNLEIGVDGGINKQTAKVCRKAGANVLIAGSAVFNEKDRAKAIAAIRGNTEL